MWPFLRVFLAAVILSFSGTLAHADTINLTTNSVDGSPVFDLADPARKLDFICCNGQTNITSLDVTFTADITAADFDNSNGKAGCTVSFAAATVIVECLAGIKAGTTVTTITTPDTSKFKSACWDPAGACIVAADPVPEPASAILTSLSVLLSIFYARRPRFARFWFRAAY
jgi:hypothetical protein